MNGRRVKALAQPTKQAFLFVLEPRDRRADLADRRAARAAVGRAKREDQPDAALPDQAAAVRSAGLLVDDLIDFTPALRAEALEVIKRYRIGPMFTPPVAERCRTARSATLQVPADDGGANWPGGSFDPETNRLYIHSHTAVFAVGIVPPTRIVGHGLRRRDRRRAVAGHSARRAADRAAGRAPARRAAAVAPARRRRPRPGGTTVQGLPLIKPPYDRITAYDMNTGDIIWQKTHSSTPDDIKNHPALKGLTCRGSASPVARSSACSRRRRC